MRIPPTGSRRVVRLNRLIRSFDIAVDLLVVSDENFQYWRDTPGNIYYEAATRRKQALLFLRKAAQDDALLDAGTFRRHAAGAV